LPFALYNDSNNHKKKSKQNEKATRVKIIFFSHCSTTRHALFGGGVKTNKKKLSNKNSKQLSIALAEW